MLVFCFYFTQSNLLRYYYSFYFQVASRSINEHAIKTFSKKPGLQVLKSYKSSAILFQILHLAKNHMV